MRIWLVLILLFFGMVAGSRTSPVPEMCNASAAQGMVSCATFRGSHDQEMRVYTLRVELTVDGEPVEVVSVDLTEGMSEVTHACVVISSAQHIDLEPLLLAEARLTIACEGLWSRRWSLILGAARFVDRERGALRHALDLYAPLHRLSLRVDVRKFRDETTEAIVSRVLSDLGVRSIWKLARPARTYDYCVQYRETSLDFVRRLLEFEGIFFTVDAEGAVILGDRSSASPPVPGEASFDLIESEGALADEAPAIHALRRTARVAPGAYVVNDRDWKHPALSLVGAAVAARDHDLEVYEAPAGYRDPREGAFLASARLEARRARTRTIDGEGSVGALAPAHAFALGDAAGAAFAGEYVLVRVEHSVRFGVAQGGPDGAPSYRNRFEAIPREVPFRPPRVTPRPTVWGFHTAIVRGFPGAEIHTDAHGRFKADFHWDREATARDDGRWLRMVQETASSMALARVGWEVGVGYVDGDPARPVGVSRLVNGAMPPAYSQPAGMQVMSIQTPSSPATGGMSELKLDDSDGHMQFALRAERDFTAVVKKDKSERVAKSERHSVGANLTRAVQRNQSVAVGADARMTVGGAAQMSVLGNRSRVVGGDEAVTIGKGVSADVSGVESETVGSTRKTNAGGLISYAASLLRTRVVGGSYVTVAMDGVGSSAKYAYVETVGGAKVTVAALGNIGDSVGKNLKVAVGGAILRASRGGIQLSAPTTSHTAGSIALRSGATIAIGGGSITLGAGTSADLSAGALALTLTPGAFKVKGRMELSAGEKIVASGKINLTKG